VKFASFKRLFSRSFRTNDLRLNRKKVPTFRPSIENLEERVVPASIIVTSATDDLSGTSLRSAIATANKDASSGTSDTITFDSSLSGATIDIPPDPDTGTKTLTLVDQFQIVNQGRVNWVNGGIVLGGSSSINNVSGGLGNGFFVTFGGTISGTGVVNNSGLFEQDAAPGAIVPFTTFIRCQFNSQGLPGAPQSVVEASFGSLLFARNGTHSGVFAAASPNSVISFDGGTQTFTNGVSLLGVGTISINGFATINIPTGATVTANATVVFGGSIGGLARPTITGGGIFLSKRLFAWTGGATPGNVTLFNQGMLQTFSNPILAAALAPIAITSGEVVNVGQWFQEASLIVLNNAARSAEIVNFGNFQNLATSSISGTGTFLNKGAVAIMSNLNFGIAFDQTRASGTRIPSETILLTGATVTFGFAPILSSGRVFLDAGTTITSATGLTIGLNAQLAGLGTVVGDVTNNGLVSPGFQRTAGTLSITGTYTQSATGRLVLRLRQTAPGGVTVDDALAVTGAASLGGRVQVLAPPGSVVAGATFPLLTYAAVVGNFATTNLPNIPGLTWTQMRGVMAFNISAAQ
jgi:hypothetical protein